MIYFSQRHKLAEMFEKWAKENNAEICSLNCITYLYSKGLLNEKKVKEWLEK